MRIKEVLSLREPITIHSRQTSNVYISNILKIRHILVAIWSEISLLNDNSYELKGWCQLSPENHYSFDFPRRFLHNSF